MSTSNNNWVCFKCRMAKRQPKSLAQVPHCLDCESEMFCLGHKVKIPSKENVGAWKGLWEDSSKFERVIHVRRTIGRVRRVHETEREILRLKALPENPERSQYIASLKERLTQ